jgi:hypothetical protein
MKFWLNVAQKKTKFFELLKHVYGKKVMSRSHGFEWCNCFFKGRNEAEFDSWTDI